MIYPGGKNAVYQKLINLIPPHRVYIEAFAGSAAVARYKRPARENILIEIDPEQVKALTAGNGERTRWEIVHGDALAFLRSYPFQGDEFIYADPPYVLSSRRQHRQLYRYELTDEQHEDLLDCLKALPCHIMISGYWSELYGQALAGWHTATFETMTRGGSLATEWLWMNYPTPVELHDYRYLGDNFRERERIKRKKQRWVKRLEKMDILERRSLLAALGEVEQCL